MSDLTRRGFLNGIAGTAVLTSLGSIAGCGGSDSRTIEWMSRLEDPHSVKVLTAAARAFERRSDATVELVELPPDTEDFQFALNRIKSGQPLEMAGTTYSTTPSWDKEGLLEPLNSAVERLGGRDAFLANSLFPTDGRYTMLPLDMTVYMMNYRGDLLNSVDEDVPRTWDDLKRVCQKLTTSDRYGISLPISSDLATTFTNTMVLWSNKVEFFDTEGNVILDQSPMKDRCVDCLEFLKELQPYTAQGMVSVTFDDIITSFLTEVVSVAPYAGRLVQNALSAKSSFASDIIMEGFPTPDGKQLAVCPELEGYAVFKGNMAEDTTRLVIEFLRDWMTDWCHAAPLHLLPALNSVWESDSWKNDEFIQGHWSLVEKQRAALESPDYIRNSVVTMQPGLTPLKSEIVNTFIIPEMYQQVLIGDSSPDVAVSDAAAKLRQLEGAA